MWLTYRIFDDLCRYSSSSLTPHQVFERMHVGLLSDGRDLFAMLSDTLIRARRRLCGFGRYASIHVQIH